MNQDHGLRIVFAGTPAFGLPCLDALHNTNHNIIAVYTQPDRPAGRGRVLQSSPIKQWALAHQVPVQQPLNFKSSQDIEILAALKPDVMVVIAYGLLLPKQVLNIPRYGCINVHASLLPRWRGASPIQQAILHGDEHSGITIMQMEEGLDTGPMLMQRTCPITLDDTAATLHDTLANLSIEPLMSVLSELAQNTIQAIIQDDSQATYAKKIQKQDALIAWNLPAINIHNQIRAFNPWPIAWITANEQILRVYSAHPVENINKHTPGEILEITKQGMLVATGKDALLIDQIQFEGKKVLHVSDWLNSAKPDQWIGQILR